VAAADVAFEELSRGGLLFLVHANADADSVGSAIALSRRFGGEIGAPAGVSYAGRKLADALATPLDPMPRPERARRVVVLDASSRVQLGPASDAGRGALLFDHHAYGDLAADALATVRDERRSSTCEVVLDFLDARGLPPDRASAQALLTGLVADSARFRFADERTFRAVARLLDLGAAYEPALALLEEEDEHRDLSRRVATLKAAARVEFVEAGGMLLATSRVGAYESAAAAGLVRMGADLAVVYTDREADRSRVSLRASAALVERGVHLGELANALARELPVGKGGGGGGGHDAAAGLNGAFDGACAAREAVARVARVLEAKR
jgi:nanoRNase/pAp phosphatase (c-di-AMP/oligoRNAs hydrolase)